MSSSQINDPLEIVQKKLNWYGTKSKKYKSIYNYLVGIDIVISALIPFVSIFITTHPFSQYIVALMGSCVTIISGFLATFQFHDLWIEYRITAERLKHLKTLFELNVYPYDGIDKIERFISDMSTIEDKENMSWSYIKNNCSSKTEK